MAEQVDTIGEVEPLHFGRERTVARTVAGNHPMEVGARPPSRVCRADQRLLILSGLERRDVHGHRRAVGDTEPRPEVERYRGRTTHLVGIDSGGDDLHLSRREPRRQQGRTHGLGDCDDDIHAPQGAGAAHREYDPARGDEAGWRAGVPQGYLAANPVARLF